MSKSKLLFLMLAHAASVVLVATAIAAEPQRWSVQFTGDVAVMRVSNNTEQKFVTATVTSLQNAGTEKFTLRVWDPRAEMTITKTAFSIQINEGIAEIDATPDLPHKVLASLVSQLKDAGITKIKFAAAKESVGTPASER